MLVYDKGGNIIMGTPILKAILVVWEDIYKIVPTVISPRNAPLAIPGSGVGCIRSSAAILAFEITRRVYQQTSST
jgi:hypothetical protein